jgi:hypothetical protein
MKHFIFFCLFAVPLFATSQNILPGGEGVVIYTDVIKVDSTINKSELFNRAKAWFVSEYKSANDVIQMQDKDAGILIGKGVFDINYNPWTDSIFGGDVKVDVSHIIKLYFKKGKYKYEITDIAGEYYSHDGDKVPVSIINLSPEFEKIENMSEFEKRNHKEMLISVNEQILNIISNMKDAMNKSVPVQDF